MTHRIGQFVQLESSGLGIIAALPDDDHSPVPHGDDSPVPEGHLGIWFGECDQDGAPIVYTIPADYLQLTPGPTFGH